jgi:hypothetical protein
MSKKTNDSPIRFLETITFFEYDVLVPINRITLIWITYGANGWELHIKGEGEFEWVEHFGKDEEKLNKRFAIIKEIVGAA